MSLTQDGKIYCFPHKAKTVLVIDASEFEKDADDDLLDDDDEDEDADDDIYLYTNTNDSNFYANNTNMIEYQKLLRRQRALKSARLVTYMYVSQPSKKDSPGFSGLSVPLNGVHLMFNERH